MPKSPPRATIAPRADPVPIFLEEYRQLYTLVLYRLSVLDQRIPLATAAITAALGSVVVLPSSMQIAFLLALPIAATLVYLSTINHARSLEDALSRIAEIELAVNTQTGPNTLRFQSSHPGRRLVGGRTGHSTVAWVHAATLSLLAICVFTQVQLVSAQPLETLCYIVAMAALAGFAIVERVRFDRYVYRAE